MMEIVKTQVGEIIVVHVSGRIDAISAPTLQTTLTQLVENGHGREMLLRLHDVDYMSAAALRVLRTLKEQAGRVCIAEPSNRVREVLQITGLDAAYEIHEALTSALHRTRPIVNAHTHLEHGWLRKGCPDVTGMDFVSWLNTSVRQPLKNVSVGWEKMFMEAAEKGIAEMQAAGITMVGDISSTGMSIPPLLKAGMHGIVYMEVNGSRPDVVDKNLSGVQELIAKWRGRMRDGLKIGLSLHTPYSVHRDLWAKALDYARKESLPLCIHVAESPAETQYLKDGGGPLKAIYSPDSAFDAPGKSPIAFLEEVGALPLKPLLVHAVQVDDADIALIKKHGCTVVHCPRSNLRLRCGRMPLEKFLAAGIPVMLGTDSLVSSPSLNIFEETEIAVALHFGKVEAQQIVKMVHGTLPGYDVAKQ